MSKKVKRRMGWAIVLVALLALISWDVTNTVAQKKQSSVYTILRDRTYESVPLQNSVVGICQSTDPELPDPAPLDATLSIAQVDSITRLAVQRAGGFESVIQPGDWVLIKVNMVGVPDIEVEWGSNLGSNTDLRVVRSVIEQLIEEGDASRITVVEGGTFRKVGEPGTPDTVTEDGWNHVWTQYGNLSYEGMVTEFDTLNPGVTVDYIDLNYPPYTETPVPGGGLSKNSYFIPDAILNCDRIINIAAMKTHSSTRLTLTQKLYVGITPGTEYTVPYYSAGYMNHMGIPHFDNAEVSPFNTYGIPNSIERTIADLISYHPPDFGIVECNWGMEGSGPTQGTPIKRNIVLAGNDPLSVDAVAAATMGHNPWDMDHLHWCQTKTGGIMNLDFITVVGPSIEDVRYDFVKCPRYNGPGYYLGRGNRNWLINGPHTGIDINYDYLGGEAEISPIEGEITAGLEWQVLADVEDYIDLERYFLGIASNCITYAFTRIIADSAMSVYLRVGSDDGIKVWLDGDSLYANANTGSYSLVEQTIPINLQQGENRLLVKIKNTTGDYGFSAIISESDGDTPLGIRYTLLAPDAPVVTLLSPVNGATTINPYMNLSASVSDFDGDTMTVWFYGDTLDASNLLYTLVDVPSPSVAEYTWGAQPLQVDGNTVGLWHFDEGSGSITYDETANDNDGIINGPVWAAGGLFGFALDYDGVDDYVNCGNDMSLSPSDSLSLEAWIYVDSITDDGNKIVARYQAYTFWVNGTDFPAQYGQLCFEIWDTGTNNWRFLFSGDNVPIGEWVYCAAICDGSEMRLYMNGELKNTTTLSGTINTSAYYTFIGAYGYTDPWPTRLWMDGRIDEVRILNRILTPDEIANRYLSSDRYYWRVVANDGVNETSSPTRYFDVGTPSGGASPNVTLNSPPNDSTTANSYMELNITVSDPEGDPMTVRIYGDTVDASDLLYTQENVIGTDIIYNWTAPVLRPDANTAALYHFEGNANDASGNGNNGTLNGGVSYNASGGRFGGAYVFDGVDDYILVSDNPSLDISDEITLEAWIYPTAVGGNTYHAIVGKRMWGGPTCNYEMFLDNVDGNLAWFDGTGKVVSSISITPNVWQHVAITLTASEGLLRFYHNGQLLDTQAGNFGPINDYNLYIGVTDDPTESFIGTIDEIMISNRALAPSEIAAHTQLGSRYYWKVTASDGVNDSTSETRYFNVQIPTQPQQPEITLNAPPNDSTTTNSYMELNITVTDPQDDPMTVWIYGDTVDASDLLYTQENVIGTDIIYNWTAPVLGPDANTAALYHFEGNANDASGNGNNGTLNGGISYSASGGRFGGAYVFDGVDDYIQVPEDPSLDMSSDITIEAWIYPTALGEVRHQALVAKRMLSGGTCNYEMFLDRDNNRNLAWFNGSGVVSSSVALTQDAWQHVAITFTSSDSYVRFYRDGVLLDSATTSMGAVNDYDLFIGMASYTGECFAGIIDEVMISNRALTSEEIAAHTQLGSRYYWKVTASDGVNDSTSETRYFNVVPPGTDLFPPEITLNAPPNDSTTSNPYMELNITVTDANPMTVWIYGDTVDASDLLYTQENVIGTDIIYNWTAPVLGPDANTAALYHFEGNANDASGNGNNGTLNGGVSYSTIGGRFGGAYVFDGVDDYIQVPEAPSLDISGDITIEAWIYPTALGEVRHQALVAKRMLSGGTCNYEMFLDRDNNRNLAWFNGSGVVSSSVALTQDTWQHVAITFTSSDSYVRFYRDGVLLDSATTSMGAVNDYDLYIGMASNLGECFAGIIDEVMISNRALTSEEIAAHTQLGSRYYWKVTASDGVNDSTSETRYFNVGTIMPPEPVTNFKAEPGHNKVSLSWTNPVDPIEGILIRRVAWVDYPEYTTAEPSYPDSPSAGDSVAFVPAPETTWVDSNLSRDIYYYTAFARNLAGNYSSADTSAQDRSTSYWLGDVTDTSGTVGNYDGYVDFNDLMILSNCFGTSQGDAGWEPEFDIGPTDDYSRTGIPEPDDVINFEDLMIFAMNFWMVEPLTQSAKMPSEEALAVELELPSNAPLVGEDFETKLIINNGAGSVKGIHLVIDFDSNSLEFIGVQESDLLKSQEAKVFFKATNANGKLDISMAILGTGVTLTESGEIAILRFKLLSDQVTEISLSSVDLRDSANQKLRSSFEGTGVVVTGRTLPKVYALHQNHPNPFNGITDINYQIPENAQITLRIYDVAGKLVRTLVDEVKEPGYYNVQWDGRDELGKNVGNGIYFYKLETTGSSLIKKMTLVR